ncbi:MAG: hypothetical protein WA988_21320 [Candidatus Nanopelagicales bacterium]
MPETTVRGWLRRARANAETIRANATVSMCGLDPLAPRINPTGTLLGDMLEAVGRATMAWEALLGQWPPAVPRLEVAALLTGGELLMPTRKGSPTGRSPERHGGLLRRARKHDDCDGALLFCPDPVPTMNDTAVPIQRGAPTEGFPTNS